MKDFLRWMATESLSMCNTLGNIPTRLSFLPIWDKKLYLKLGEEKRLFSSIFDVALK